VKTKLTVPPVTVDVSEFAPELSYPFVDYVVLFDPTVEEINALAKLRPETFILSFVTKGDINNLPNMNGIVMSNYVMMPYWLAHFEKEDQAKVVREIIDKSIWSWP